MVEFPISGVETYWWLPGVTAFLIASITSTGGVTGAFVLLPFQISVLGYTSPGASSTNLLYNVFAIPGGVWRYHREKRMVWPLVLVTVVGLLPGMLLGAVVRLKYLPDPQPFKLFAGLVLMYLGGRLLWDLYTAKATSKPDQPVRNFEVSSSALEWKQIGFNFDEHSYHAPTVPILVLSFLVGTVGGAYGIGGGAVLAPYLVAVYHLPVHAVAGAALVGTFITSVFGVAFYILLGPVLSVGSAAAMPDWWLGLSFGLGGAAGVYVGARLQRFLPARVIKGILIVVMLLIAVKYIREYLL
jgi:uncharacterized membrane protein YfcA